MMHLRQRWEPIPGPFGEFIAGRMWEVLQDWKPTRYMSGQRCRGTAADCIGFGCGVIDDLDGRPRAQDPSLPPDTALHSPRSAYRAVAALRRLYAPARRLRAHEALQPGDLIVAGSEGGGPGHMMLVGPNKNTLWHCSSGAGVQQTGWALVAGATRLFAAYRIMDRHRWAGGAQ